MKTALYAVILSITFLCHSGAQVSERHGVKRSEKTTPFPVRGPHSRPVIFEPNLGQAEPSVRYLARGSGFSLILTDEEAVITERGKQPIHLQFAGANNAPRFEALEPTGGVSNYYIGSDRSLWRTGVPHYRRIRVHNIYPGIDEIFYGSEGQLEFDLVVSPGVDPAKVTMNYPHMRSVQVDADGDLHAVGGDSSNLVVHRPFAYQRDASGELQQIAADFRLSGPREAGFRLGSYDETRELIIDPTVQYASYLGGSSNEQGDAIAVDSAGNAYVAGLTRSTDFPTVKPISSSGYGGGISDAFITKINPTGTTILYSTYLGGSDTDQANAVAVDSAGNAYLTGLTKSSNFPVQNALQFMNKDTQFGTAFVAKLNVSGMLVYSTFLGGSYNSSAAGDVGNGIGVDAQGNAYISGTTLSPDFPVKNAIQAIKGQQRSMFVSKLSADGSNLLYSTFYGGTFTYGFQLAVDGAGNAYVAGEAYVTQNFPKSQNIAPLTDGDLFVLKLTPTGTLGYSTLISAMQLNGSASIAIDSSGNAYVAGNAPSPFPLVKPLYSTFSSNIGFIAKLNPAGSALVYSTYLPGCMITSIATDAAANVYVTGYGNSSQFPLKNAFQSTPQQNVSAIITALDSTGSSLLYSTFVGANADGLAIASDAAGDVFVTGYGLGMPPDNAAFQPNPKGYPDAFVFAYYSGSGPTATTVSAASFASGPVALNSIATAFGTDLATQSLSTSGTLGTSLGGTMVNITDAHNVTTPAQLFFVSAGQVNFLIPASVALGSGQIQIQSADGTSSVGPITIAAVSPGVFTADGKVPVGSIVQVDGQGNQISTNLAQYNSATGKFSPAPINLGPSDTQTVLTLYGTGIRNALLSQISVSLAGQSVTPTFAGIQGTFAGLDQINIPIPRSLAGSGDIAVTLTAAGAASNTVHILVQ